MHNSEPEEDVRISDQRVSSREALRFLNRAGRLLSASLDLDQTLRRVVRLAVPRVACFAMIDLKREDGRLQRVSFGHVDDALEPLLDRTEPFAPRDEGLVPLARAAEEGTPLLLEQVERDWDGGPQGLERLRRLGARSLIIVPMKANDDRILGTLTFGSTRTDRFYHDTDLAVAHELARTAAFALENARLFREAERAIAARDEILAVVSHDLRNPLNRIRMGAEMLLDDGGLPDGAERTLGIVVRAADEMNRLIGDLLDVSRIEAGRLSIAPAMISLSRLLERVDESHAAAAAGAGIAWQVERPAEDATLEADEGRLLQALGNLIGNALKFTPAGRAVRVVAEPGPETIRIGVLDQGPGLEPEALARVFDRFWQSQPGDRRGAGLGLAIARGLIEAHGGRVWLESELGRGTRAWVELPRRTPA